MILRSKDKKTGEVASLPPFRLPYAHQHLAIKPTAVEARHFAATWCLFRLCNNRNLHMAMPPFHRDLWKGVFQEIKANDTKDGDAWLYAVDPFLALREHQDAEIRAPKGSQESNKSKSQASSKASAASKRSPPGWKDAPSIDMGKRTRILVQNLVQKYASWNRFDMTIPKEQGEHISCDLVNLGFRQSHVDEAMKECGSREEVIEWLLSYLPEDDLPPWSLPEDYMAGISLASLDVRREAALKRLSTGGYGLDLCDEVLTQCKDSESQAAQTLQDRLAGGIVLPSDHNEVGHGTDSSDGLWGKEVLTLQAIFGDRIECLSPTGLQLTVPCNHPIGFITLQIQKPVNYPTLEPVLRVLNKELPAYIKLSITRDAISHARASCLGSAMIFNLVSWLEDALPNVMKNPGCLKDLSKVSAIPQAITFPSLARPPRARGLASVALKVSSAESQRLLEEWRKRRTHPRQQELLANRKRLPAWSSRKDIVEIVEHNQVTIISGETGSGKSTQVGYVYGTPLLFPI